MITEKVKTAVYFKVVGFDGNGDRVSAFATKPPYKITYHPDREIRALKGSMGCMAFTNIRSARIFTLFCLYPTAEIWECAITNPRVPNWVLGDINNIPSVLRMLDYLTGMDSRLTLADLAFTEALDWVARQRPYLRFWDVTSAPPGTICGDTLKLIRYLETYASFQSL